MDNIDPDERPRKKPPIAYRLKLRTPDGTILAYCPTRRAGVQTATAIHDRLEVVERDGIWELWKDGELKATVGK